MRCGVILALCLAGGFGMACVEEGAFEDPTADEELCESVLRYYSSCFFSVDPEEFVAGCIEFMQPSAELSHVCADANRALFECQRGRYCYEEDVCVFEIEARNAACADDDRASALFEHGFQLHHHQ